ncbi:MAG: hypothetical protein ACXWQE_04655 [Bdellovibrionales bacterium]
MLNLSIFCQFLAIAFLCSSSYGQAAGTILNLSQVLNRSNVVLVGWDHAEGSIVPELLAEELPMLGQAETVLVVEKPKDHLIESETLSDEEQKLYRRAEQLGIQIIPGDHPKKYEDAQKFLAIVRDEARTFDAKLQALAIAESSVSDEERDTEFANVIEQLHKQGKRVILLIGSSHLKRISELLKSKSIDPVNMKIDLDFLSLRLSVNGRTVGYARPSETIMLGRQLHLYKLYRDAGALEGFGLLWKEMIGSMRTKVRTCEELLSSKLKSN